MLSAPRLLRRGDGGLTNAARSGLLCAFESVDMLFIVLPLVALGLGVGLLLHRRGSPAGAVCVGLSALAAVGAAIGGVLSTGPGPEAMENVAGRFDLYAGEFLGTTLAEQHPGAAAVVVLPPESGEREASILDGLRRGFGDRVTLVGTRVPEPPQSYRDELDRLVRAGEYDAEMIPMALASHTQWFTSGELAALMDSLVGEADLVVAVLAVPPVAGRPAWPVLALVNAPIHRLRDTIGRGTIAAAVTWRPDPRSWPSIDRLPSGLKERFDKRFILVTPDNVAALDRAHPKLFEEPL